MLIKLHIFGKDSPCYINAQHIVAIWKDKNKQLRVSTILPELTWLIINQEKQSEQQILDEWNKALKKPTVVKKKEK